jgi:hypothetical protein
MIVKGNKSIQKIVSVPSSWNVTTVKKSKTIPIPKNLLINEIGHQSVIITSQELQDKIKCSTNNKTSKIIEIIGIICLILGIVFKIVLHQLGYDDPTLQDCINQFDEGLCKSQKYMNLTVISFPLSHKILIGFIIVGSLILLFKSIAFGSLGNYFVNDDNDVNCIECNNRGPGWEYIYPTKESTDLSSIGLIIKKIRCRYAGKCVCTNSNLEGLCEVTANNTGQKDLKWRSFISSKFMDKDSAKTSHPINPINVCACCVSDDGKNCVLLNNNGNGNIACNPSYLKTNSK